MRPENGRNKAIEDAYKEQVLTDLRNGMTLEEIVRKYPVSLYYVKKWGGIVYKDENFTTLVRARYRLLVSRFSGETLSRMSDRMKDYEACDISAETWDHWDSIIRQEMYRLCEEIAKKS